MSSWPLVVPAEVEIVDRIQEAPNIFTWSLRFTDSKINADYRCMPGQFNMLYMHGVGEIPISIVGQDEDRATITHTIQAVGRVTDAMAKLGVGDRLGLRGPFGRGWPLRESHGRDLVIVTGGLGCAPVVAVIHHAMANRQQYGRIVIMQGVKHANDLLWRKSYEQWAMLPDVQVLLAADVAVPGWSWATGRLTALLDQARFDQKNCMVMMCGPEAMMGIMAEQLIDQGVDSSEIWLSMERSMNCAIGHCGHCQLGPHFICKDGPVYPYPEICDHLAVRGI
ncbi:MAG: FAD/NAD(P)-binding protein [Gammaproteobacteria bacterium]|nr:FAD/NAD(P)-binding protein [Gammaproteobacteria bacterium]